MSNAGIACFTRRPTLPGGADLDARVRTADTPCRSGAYDPDLWFPDMVDCALQRMLHAEAFALCEACPVMWECRQLAVRRGEAYGIWGATSACDRLTLRAHTRGRNQTAHVRGCATQDRTTSTRPAMAQAA